MSAAEKKSQITTEVKPQSGTAVTTPHKRTETSVLGQRLLEYWERVKQGQSRLLWYVLGVAVVLLALFFVWRWFTKDAEAKNSARWLKLDGLSEEAENYPDDTKAPLSAQDKQVKVLEEFIKINEGKPQARIARFQLARLLLTRGMRELGQPRFSPGARKSDDLKRAADLYRGLAQESSDTPVLAQEALLNEGKAREALGDLDAARSRYDTLKTEYPNSASGKEAEVLYKRLSDAASRDEIKRLTDALNKS